MIKHFIIYCFLLLNNTFLFAQFKTSFDDGGLPDIMGPKLIRIDTVINLECPSLKANYFCLRDYDAILTFSDSSKDKLFSIEQGYIKNHKKYGKWRFIKGGYYNESRVNSIESEKYYFHDYEIFNDEKITRRIEIDTLKQTAYCKFVYFNNKDTIDMQIDYRLSKTNNDIIAQCTTKSGKFVFETTIDNMKKEFRSLIRGGYNERIYAR